MAISHQIQKAKTAKTRRPAATKPVLSMTDGKSVDTRKWAAHEILSQRHSPTGAPPMSRVLEEAEALAQYVATGKVPEK